MTPAMALGATRVARRSERSGVPERGTMARLR